jgi:hypothetical protein
MHERNINNTSILFRTCAVYLLGDGGENGKTILKRTLKKQDMRI